MRTRELGLNRRDLAYAPIQPTPIDCADPRVRRPEATRRIQAMREAQPLLPDAPAHGCSHRSDDRLPEVSRGAPGRMAGSGSCWCEAPMSGRHCPWASGTAGRFLRAERASDRPSRRVGGVVLQPAFDEYPGPCLTTRVTALSRSPGPSGRTCANHRCCTDLTDSASAFSCLPSRKPPSAPLHRPEPSAPDRGRSPLARSPNRVCSWSGL